MKETRQRTGPVLLAGNHPLKEGIANCLRDSECDFELEEMAPVSFGQSCELAILVTEEDCITKKKAIDQLEKVLGPTAIIAVNTETIDLELLQKSAAFPDRIMGVNWTAPADKTFFLEIIANEVTNPAYTDRFMQVATDFWNKDPYVIHGNTGVRMKLLGALIREAFYLVHNEYATVEDIDRACRNDAGYYSPFAGNLRYMDLMGTYAYGMVMKDLNPELATDQHVPEFFEKMVSENECGMESGKGFYPYQLGEAEKWQELLGKFSGEVRELIEKYPFKYEPTHF
ncbi:3-hydroxyacyl-CoA dehydrogenase family protein [Dyadobacter sp. CY323]|uniref:3-hydroxyacyl-CoA dehydrogenase family protein n=1 Tax=Dyadobacter sp. CY323 TaxID=2907302 RepID=UPI001F2AC6D9|nr:3-hydroxyacyl-CoA dehydrogenase family protein [Dyadobacter sp. CY323]MCE6989684.1 3-hydroxyacyl-CoA dehydrogenase family protein [Dyadobacter sp. CY323]